MRFKFMRVGFVVTCLLLATAVCAQAASKGMIWEVKSGRGTTYLLGSIHVFRQDLYPLQDAIEQAFQQSKVLIVEADIRGLDGKKALEVMQARGTFQDGRSLEETVSKKTYALVRKNKGLLGNDLATINRAKPWYASTLVATLELSRAGFDVVNGVDSYFMNRAGEGKKKVVALETVDEQFRLFDQLSDESQDEMLFETLRELKGVSKDMNQMLERWSSGDGAHLEKLVKKEFLKNAEAYRVLLTERNQRWLPRIQACITQGESCMVVVGAAHLLGADGLIEQLRKQGYDVRQL